MLNLKEAINRIENILFVNAQEMADPTLEKSLSGAVFIATLYNYSKEPIYKDKVLTLFNQLLERFAEYEFLGGLLEGFDGVAWVIQYFNKCGIDIDASVLSELDPYLLRSIKLDIKNNNFDLFYGSIGKFQYYLETDQKETEELVQEFVNTLYANRQETSEGIFWHDETRPEMVNLGVAHGMPSILIFLTRLVEYGYDNPLIITMINGIVKSLLSFQNAPAGISSFGDSFSYTQSTTAYSRLAWCYGDLGITYGLLYSSKVLNREDWKIEAHKMVNRILSRSISDSGLTHFHDYSFFDTAFCHGLAGISYIINKIGEFVEHPLLQDVSIYWQNELLKNLNTHLSIEGDIYYPSTRQNQEKSHCIDQTYMLNGLPGTGLVLLSHYYKKSDWSNFFLMY